MRSETNLYKIDLVRLNNLKKGIELFYGKIKKHDLEPKIIEMVNNNFEELLLK